MHVLDIGGEYTFDQVKPAGFEIGKPHRGIDDRQEYDAIDEDIVLVPVVGEPLEHHAVLLNALDEFVRTGADRMQAELVAFRFYRLGRDHRAGAVGELGNKRRIRIFQYEFDGEWVHHLDMVDAGEFRFTERAGHVDVPLDREFRSRGVERLAVMKFDAGPKLDRHFLSVGRSLVGQRELRHDVELLVDVEQLVAKGREYNASDIGSPHGRIEHVGIFGKADAQGRLGLRVRNQQHRKSRCGRSQAQSPHGPVLLNSNVASMLRYWPAIKY